MTILLVDVDSSNGFPNLALMKISAGLKKAGEKVDLIKGIPESPPLDHYDAAYFSCIFFQNRDRMLQYANLLDCDCNFGGPGYDLTIELAEWEHLMPDYSLYGVDFSMGFTSRGCIRHCGFCIVPEKEGTIRDNAPVSEFWNPDHSKVVLLDNNFLASPRWRENISFIREHGLYVNFNQGLDIRLMNEEIASSLAELRYYCWNFKTRGLHFAFDSMKIESAVIRGMDLLRNAGTPARHIMFYILVGYDTTETEDLRRIEIVKGLGAIPYIMPYNRTKSPLARWVNRRYYQFIPYANYCQKVADK